MRAASCRRRKPLERALDTIWRPLREPVESQRQQGLRRDNYVFKGSLNGRVELRAGVDNALKGGPKGHAEPISGRVLATESRQAGPGRFNPIVRAPVWKLGFGEPARAESRNPKTTVLVID